MFAVFIKFIRCPVINPRTVGFRRVSVGFVYNGHYKYLGNERIF